MDTEDTEVMLRRWPCTWLTLQGYTYHTGHHPSDVVSAMLVLGALGNPQLGMRVRETAWAFHRRSYLAGRRVVYEDSGSVFVEDEEK